jgi:hypothetical protein
MLILGSDLRTLRVHIHFGTKLHESIRGHVVQQLMMKTSKQKPVDDGSTISPVSEPEL